MGSMKKKSSDFLLNATVALKNGNSDLCRTAGIPEEIILNIQRIMNIYSYVDANFLTEVIALFLEYHDPGTAIVRLDRFMEKHGKTLDFHLSDDVVYILASVFSSSGALSNRIIGDSSLIGYCAKLKNPLSTHLTIEYFHTYIRALTDSPNYSDRIKAIHQAHTIHLMRICARNTSQDADISEINAELSLLADAIIESCIDVAHHELCSQMDISERPHSLIVLGLGKLGGNELNVSSDIDLIYLCHDSEEVLGNYTTLHYHTFLAERLSRILSEATQYGYLYRVDTRLRADGSAGPLVRLTTDYFRYLEMRGEAWERQMLLKARPVAGNVEEGYTFLKSINRFIFPTSISRSPHREIVELKKRIEARIIAEGSKKTHLKLMPGGIRDIEFIVQCLQLLMGGLHPEVHSTGTLATLVKLKEFKALNDNEYTVLAGAYQLYRKIENALQWQELLPAFTFPDSPGDIATLAAAIHFRSADESRPGDLSAEIGRNLNAVRKIFNDIFNADEEGSFEEMALQTAMNPEGDDKIRRFMETLGFNNPSESALSFSRLAFGNQAKPNSGQIHVSTERFIPKLLKALSDLPDPSGALERFQRLVESYKARTMLFDICNDNPSFLELLLSITHGSLFITDIIAKDPSLLDWLVEVGALRDPLNRIAFQKELNNIAASHSSDDKFSQTCLSVKNREKLRIGARDITRISTTTQTFSELSAIAESVVMSAYAFANNRGVLPSGKGKLAYSFCIIAGGRLGSGMMDFGSDIDLIFVYRAQDENAGNIEIPEMSVKFAQHILQLLTGGGGANKLYDVDARLRPEGGNSAITVSLEQYESYLENRASVWERLALMRSRCIAGDAKLGSDTITALHYFVYRGTLSTDEIKNIMNIRQQMRDATIKRYHGRINVKSGPGGLTDIDFIAQTYAAHFGKENLGLRHRETTEILKALGDAAFLDKHDVSTLMELFSFLCNVEKALRISSGRSVNTLPKSSVDLARVSRLLEFRNSRRFRKKLEDVISLTMELYDRLMADLLERALEQKTQQ